jgi:hypothetical protein
VLIALNDICLPVLTVPLRNKEWIIHWICFGYVKERKRWVKRKEERGEKYENRKKI